MDVSGPGQGESAALSWMEADLAEPVRLDGGPLARLA
jgi:hypothetical protein